MEIKPSWYERTGSTTVVVVVVVVVVVGGGGGAFVLITLSRRHDVVCGHRTGSRNSGVEYNIFASEDG